VSSVTQTHAGANANEKDVSIASARKSAGYLLTPAVPVFVADKAPMEHAQAVDHSLAPARRSHAPAVASLVTPARSALISPIKNVPCCGISQGNFSNVLSYVSNSMRASASSLETITHTLEEMLT